MQPAPSLAPGSSPELLWGHSAVAGGKATMPWLDGNVGKRTASVPQNAEKP
jgi:hypothetical protein